MTVLIVFMSAFILSQDIPCFQKNLFNLPRLDIDISGVAAFKKLIPFVFIQLCKLAKRQINLYRTLFFIGNPAFDSFQICDLGLLIVTVFVMVVSDVIPFNLTK